MRSNILGSMIEVFRIPVPKSQLRAIPQAERALLLLATHAVNQITTLIRLLTFSTNFVSENALENTLSAAQSQIILRFLFGATAEAWEMARRPPHQKIIGSEYLKIIPPEGAASYQKLNRLFGKSNLLHRIRNELAFHLPSVHTIETAFGEVPEDEDWAWYAATNYSNSFYLASDFVISAGIIRETGEADVASAFGRVMDEVITASNELTEFFSYLIGGIVSRRLDPAILSPARGSGEIIRNAPGLRTFAIPFFTLDEPRSK
jgi:hypothetical protein